jgi:hypothetical protein
MLRKVFYSDVVPLFTMVLLLVSMVLQYSAYRNLSARILELEARPECPQPWFAKGVP